MLSIGIVGAGQFASHFAKLFNAHPDVERVVATDLERARAEAVVAREGLAGTANSFEALLDSINSRSTFSPAIESGMPSRRRSDQR